jgi:hypothetical protein
MGVGELPFDLARGLVSLIYPSNPPYKIHRLSPKVSSLANPKPTCKTHIPSAFFLFVPNSPRRRAAIKLFEVSKNSGSTNVSL